jgi:deaminated glutathione amidase
MRIALCQLTSTADPKINLERVAEHAERAAAGGAAIAVFPEATMARFGAPLAPVAEPLDGPWATEVAAIAERAGLIVAAGMFTPAPDGRVHNTLLFTGAGHHLGYHKIHLFDAFGFVESKTVAPGDEIVTVDLGELTVGLATCYDVRFPELFRALADKGADAILLPASWGAGPGKREQWEVLVRARAMDSTAWILACDQADPAASGVEVPAKAPTGIGHTLAVDPYGAVTGTLDAAPDLLFVDIDRPRVESARRDIPSLANRRL